LASVFILGPGHWEAQAGKARSPRHVRTHVASLLHGRHHTFLMEDIADHPEDRDLTDKFLRILETQKTTDILVYWPKRAKMQTTLDEFLHLRHALDRGLQPNVWLLVQSGIMEIDHGRYEIKKGSVLRSRYLDAIHTLNAHLLPWTTHKDLYRIVLQLRHLL